MSTEPPPGTVSVNRRAHVSVNRRYSVSQNQEPGIVISVRDYERFIERLEDCKPGGWADLWLAGVGAGVALAVGALVGALTLPVSMSGPRDVLWVLTAAGAIVFVLCLVAYFTQRRNHEREISGLKRDLQIHMDRAKST